MSKARKPSLAQQADVKSDKNKFSVTSPYTGFLADRTFLQMKLFEAEETDKNMFERLGRYLKYMDYIYTKTWPYQEITNTEFKK
jgi:hypothetical protein